MPSLQRWAGACLWLVALAAPAQTPHVVKPGETLWGISGQYLEAPLRWPEIQQRNQVGEPRRLQPGTVLYFADGRVVPEGSAVVAAVEGAAWRRRAGEADQALAPGMPIAPGDTLLTGREAFVTLGLPNGSRAVLPSRSAVEVLAVDASTIRLRLIEGRVESQVNRQHPGQQFEIRARSLGLGVRGTHFRVRDEDGVLTGEVLSGEVVVRKDAKAPGDTLVLRAGDGAVLEGEGSTAGARALLPAPRLAAATEAPGTQESARTVQLVPVPGAETYRLQVARDERFLLPVHEQSGPGPAFTVPPALERGFYHLRMTAFDARRVEGLPGDTIVYLPSPGGDSLRGAAASVMADGRVEIRWAGVAGRRYAFELSRSADFALPLLSEPAVYAAGMVVGPLGVAGRYHWRVREMDSGAATGGSFDIPVR